MILAAVFAIAPVGRMRFPDLIDADMVFLRVMESEFSPLFRGLAVAAVMAAVMSTTDALLLACSSAIAHDLIGQTILKRSLDYRAARWLAIGSAWGVGLVAMVLAYSPPALISQFYTAAIGLLTSGLFVPTIAGLWWRRANVAGGVAALVVGVLTYLAAHFSPGMPPLSAILVALPASAVAMWLGGALGPPAPGEMLKEIERLHGG